MGWSAADWSDEAATDAPRALIRLKSGSLIVEVDSAAPSAQRVLERALPAAAVAAGIADWIVGPFPLPRFQPPKCYGRIIYNREFPETLAREFAHAAYVLERLLRAEGFTVVVVEESARPRPTKPPPLPPPWLPWEP